MYEGENVTKCEELGKENCAFAVSSSGYRCVLEKMVRRSGEEAYSCRASSIDAAESLKSWVESDHCINSCGLDRNSLGISSDSFLDARFASKLCSQACYGMCPNVVDLYFNLAAGEGVFLPKFCEAQKSGSRRGMAELKSSGIADGPTAAADGFPEELALAPAPAIEGF